MLQIPIAVPRSMRLHNICRSGKSTAAFEMALRKFPDSDCQLCQGA